jgi:hypothetical protein
VLAEVEAFKAAHFDGKFVVGVQVLIGPAHGSVAPGRLPGDAMRTVAPSGATATHTSLYYTLVP